MQEILIKSEPWVRLSFFIFFFLTIAWFEQRYPWRYLLSSLKDRWSLHLGFVLASNFFVRLIIPVALVKLAYEVQHTSQASLLQLPEMQALPLWTHYIIGFMVLDLVMYWQHRVFHRIKLFWRLHLMHHTDKEMDLSTGLRFHPLEYLFIVGFKMMGVVLIAPPAMVVVLYEVLFNAAAMFTHANLKLNPDLERSLRWVMVTPEMHRVHHSDIPSERNKNFGFLFSFWDRLLRTYQPFSRMSDRKIVPGVEEFWGPEYQTVQGMLLQPFYRKKKKKGKRKQPLLMKASDQG